MCDENGICFKDATPEAKAACVQLFEVGFGLIFPVEAFERVYDFPMEIWKNIDKYKSIEENGFKALDTYDRDFIIEVFWARMFGYPIPNWLMSDVISVVRDFCTNEKNNGWTTRLYDYEEVINRDESRRKHTDSTLFSIDSFELPEPIEIKGHRWFVDALKEYFEENQETINKAVKEKITARLNKSKNKSKK